MREAV